MPTRNQDIPRRKPVWAAMSRLFLDTRLDHDELSEIARVIRQAGFSVEEAEDILTAEVAPVFASNLVSVAGEWAGWNDDDVAELVLARLQKRSRLRWIVWPRRWLQRRLVRLVADDWAVIKQQLSKHV